MSNTDSKTKEIIKNSAIDFESIAKTAIRFSFAEIVRFLLILFIVVLAEDFY